MLPDPLEIANSRIDDLAFEWEVLQRNALPGHFVCPFCKQNKIGEPIQISSNPDSPVGCYDCLTDDLKKAYDNF
jgi:hypothetical protein